MSLESKQPEDPSPKTPDGQPLPEWVSVGGGAATSPLGDAIPSHIRTLMEGRAQKNGSPSVEVQDLEPAAQGGSGSKKKTHPRGARGRKLPRSSLINQELHKETSVPRGETKEEREKRKAEEKQRLADVNKVLAEIVKEQQALVTGELRHYIDPNSQDIKLLLPWAERIHNYLKGTGEVPEELAGIGPIGVRFGSEAIPDGEGLSEKQEELLQPSIEGLRQIINRIKKEAESRKAEMEKRMVAQQVQRKPEQRAQVPVHDDGPKSDGGTSPHIEPAPQPTGTNEGYEYWEQAGVVGFGSRVREAPVSSSAESTETTVASSVSARDERAFVDDQADELNADRINQEREAGGIDSQSGNAGLPKEQAKSEDVFSEQQRSIIEGQKKTLEYRRSEYTKAQGELEEAQQKLLEERSKLTIAQRVGKMLGTGAEEYQKAQKVYQEKQSAFYKAVGALHGAAGTGATERLEQKKNAGILTRGEESPEQVVERIKKIIERYERIYGRALESDDMWLEKQREAQEAVPPKGKLLRTMQSIGKWYSAKPRWVRYGVVPLLGATAGSMLTGAALSVAITRRAFGSIAGAGGAAFVMNIGTDHVNRREAARVREAKESFAFTNAQATLEKLRDARLKAASGRKWTRRATLATAFGLGVGATMLIDPSAVEATESSMQSLSKDFFAWLGDDTVTPPVVEVSAPATPPTIPPSSLAQPLSGSQPSVEQSWSPPVSGEELNSIRADVREQMSGGGAEHGGGSEASTAPAGPSGLGESPTPTPAEPGSPASHPSGDVVTDVGKGVGASTLPEGAPASPAIEIHSGTYEAGSSITREIDQWLAKEKPDLPKEVRQAVAWRIAEEQVAHANADPVYAKGLGIMRGDSNLVARGGTYTMELPKGAPLQAHIDRVLEVRGAGTPPAPQGEVVTSGGTPPEPVPRPSHPYIGRQVPLERPSGYGFSSAERVMSTLGVDVSPSLKGQWNSVSRLLAPHVSTLEYLSQNGTRLPDAGYWNGLPHSTQREVIQLVHEITTKHGTGVFYENGKPLPLGLVLEHLDAQHTNSLEVANFTTAPTIDGGLSGDATEPQPESSISAQQQTTGGSEAGEHAPKVGENKYGFHYENPIDAALSRRIGVEVEKGRLTLDGWLHMRTLPVQELHVDTPGYLPRSWESSGVPRNDIVGMRTLLQEIEREYTRGLPPKQLPRVSASTSVIDYMRQLGRGVARNR